MIIIIMTYSDYYDDFYDDYLTIMMTMMMSIMMTIIATGDGIAAQRRGCRSGQCPETRVAGMGLRGKLDSHWLDRLWPVCSPHALGCGLGCLYKAADRRLMALRCLLAFREAVVELKHIDA